MAKKRPVKYGWIVPSCRKYPVVAVEELAPLPDNPNAHPAEQHAKVVASLRRFGQRVPLVVNKTTGHVINGNDRLAGAIELGWTHVAVGWVEVPAEQEHALSAKFARAVQLSTWDETTLRAMLAEQEGTEAYVDLLLGELAELVKAEEPAAEEEAAGGQGPRPAEFLAVGRVETEAEQERLYELLVKRGEKVQLSVMG